MSKTETEKTIKSFLDLENSIKPFISKVDESKKRVENLKKSLAEFQAKFEAIEKKLTGLLKQSEEALAQGQGIKFNDSIFAAKAEKTDLEEWISQIQNESIPQAKAAVDFSITELRGKFLEGVNPLRLAYLGRLKEIYASADSIWSSYLGEIKALMRKMQDRYDIVLVMSEIDEIFVKDFRLLK